MAQVEERPGPLTPLRPRTRDDEPAHARHPGADARAVGDEQPPPPRLGRGLSTSLGLVWVLAFVALGVLLAVLRSASYGDRPDQVAASALGVLAAIGLASRAGGRILLPALLSTAVAATALLTRWEPLLAGTAMATGVLVACLAVLGTTPAPRFLVAAREVTLALVVALAGALAVAGFHVGLAADRFGYTVLGLGVLACAALVHRLGGGLHGLGRGGLVVAAGALVLLVLGLGYTVALGRWGPPEMTGDLASVRSWCETHLGAVPRPIVVLIGVPALTWGVSMRDRRRQGWWVCAYGVTGTAATCSLLVDPATSTGEAALGTAYALVLGLLLGYAVVRLSRALGRTRGRRTRRDDQAHRPEPGRLRPLH